MTTQTPQNATPEPDDFLDDDEEEFEEDLILRAKWTIDGADTLAQAAEQLRAFAAELDKLSNEGWLLRSIIDGDYGFAYHPDPKIMNAWRAEQASWQGL